MSMSPISYEGYSFQISLAAVDATQLGYLLDRLSSLLSRRGPKS
jgi:hypothetical protein